MEIEHKNQNNINFEDTMDSFEIDYVYENKPLKRTFDELSLKDKQSLIENLIISVLRKSDNTRGKISSSSPFSLSFDWS